MPADNVKNLFDAEAITAATTVTGKVISIPDWVKNIQLDHRFVSGSGGTAVKAYLQTTIDGANWFDIQATAFTTSDENAVASINGETPTTAPLVPGDAALTDDTQINIIGQKLRMKYVSTGTYTGANLTSNVRLT